MNEIAAEVSAPQDTGGIVESSTVQSSEPNITTSETPTTSTEFNIPDAYKEKGWTKQVSSPDDLWKTADDLQSLKGKKDFGLPENNASDEQWSAYFEKVRPENTDGYVLHEEGAEFHEGLETGIKQAMHDAGLHPKQAQIIADAYSKLTGELVESTKADNKSHDDAEFDKLATEMFGGQDEAAAAIKTVRAMLPDLVDDSIVEHIGELDNTTLLTFASMANKLNQKFGVESNAMAGGANGTAVKSPSDMRAEAQALMQTREAMPKQQQTMSNPQFNKITTDINNLYKTIGD